MRGVVGGTVTSTELWEYADKKTGEIVKMQSVFILAGGRQVEKVTVPLDLGPVAVGAEVFYEADISVSKREHKGQVYADLSIWARKLAPNPFVDRSKEPTAQTAGRPLQPVVSQPA